MTKELTKNQLIERSIITKFRKTIWSPFATAIKRYKLISPNDSIAVCISGGKDSMLMAKLMQELKRHGECDFDLKFIVMNPGYADRNLQQIIDNARLMEIPVHIFDSQVFEISEKLDNENPCYMCARMRRGHLYAEAQKLGCNKIALGHHKSDVIETTLMSMLFGGQIQGMMPRIKSTNFKGLELIRPMYCILEEDIEKWRDYNELEFLQCACSFTEKTHADTSVDFSARKYVKNLIKSLKNDIPDIENSLFKSIHNVKLDTLVEYKQKGKIHNFLDNFED